MSQSQSFPVDLLNREDVREKLPRAREIATEKDARAAVASKDAAQWTSFLQLLVERAELPDEPETAADDLNGDAPKRLYIDFSGVESLLDAVVRTVNEQNRPIRSKEVAELLRASGKFEGLTNEAVSNSLYYASERAEPPRLRKLEKRGFYGPIDESLPV